jgi:hypothetical protein
MATRTDGRLAGATARRPSRRAFVGGLAAIALLLAAWTAAGGGDDDVPVDPDTPQARAAVAAALDVVRGRVAGVTQDRDSGKWEIAVVQDGREYEVELSNPGLELLRLDYNTD